MPNNEYHGNNDLLQINSVTTASITSTTGLFNGAVQINGGITNFSFLRMAYRRVTVTPDAMINGDCILGIAVIPCTTTLPSPAAVGAGFTLRIKDELGTASGANPITIAPNAGEKIDTVAGNYLITVGFGSVDLYTDGTDWFVV